MTRTPFHPRPRGKGVACAVLVLFTLAAIVVSLDFAREHPLATALALGVLLLLEGLAWAAWSRRPLD